MQALAEEISKPTEPTTLLDIGCGTGGYSIPLKRKFSLHVTGIDTSREMLNLAQEKEHDADWINADFLDWSSPSHFDIILMIYVLHLVNSWRLAIRKAVRTLSRDGVILLVTEDHVALRNSLVHKHMPRILEIDLARFPEVQHVMDEFSSLKLSTTVRKIVTEHELRTSSDVEKFLHAVEARYISTLQFLHDDELKNGVALMRHTLINQIKAGPIKRTREKSLVIAKHRF